MIAFFQSLGLFGYLAIAFVVLLLFKLRSMFRLRTPLDSQQHLNWRMTGGTTEPDHLTQDKKKP